MNKNVKTNKNNGNFQFGFYGTNKNLPKLIGSEKQVEIATPIRDTIVDGYRFFFQKFSKQIQKELINKLVENKDAKYWIALKNLSLVEMGDYFALNFPEELKMAYKMSVAEMSPEDKERFSQNVDKLYEKSNQTIFEKFLIDLFLNGDIFNF